MIHRSGSQWFGQARKRYLDVIINEPCPGLDVLCREGHNFLWDIVPGFFWWLVRCSVHHRILCGTCLLWCLTEQRLLLVWFFATQWIIWWLVRGLGGGHCRGMDQRCTRVDARYGCWTLDRDLPLIWRQTRPTPQHPRQHSRQRKTRRLLKMQTRNSFRLSQRNEMRTNSS